MISNWLWDKKIKISQAKRILKDPNEKDFILLASLLLSRENKPKEIFKDYLDPILFCKHWPAIKRRMRENKWNEPRIIFWQAIYERLSDKYHKQGMTFRKEKISIKIPLCEDIGRRIKTIRREEGLSQKEFAKRMGVSQQLISRIEKGRENISLATLDTLVSALGKKTDIIIS